MIRKHLFLRLYKWDFWGYEKPLTFYIKDFDKNIDLMHNEFGGLKTVLLRKFRNLDELFLDKTAIFNCMFSLRYMKYLQNNNIETREKSLHDIFEMSMLTDVDDKPKDPAFYYAYYSDYKRHEIKMYSSYYRLLTWYSLGLTDIELMRRVEDCLVNSNPSSIYFSLDNGVNDFRFNPFFDNEKNIRFMTFPNEKVNRHKDYEKKLMDIERVFLDKINVPDDVFFDGYRFIVIDNDSPTSLIFELGSSTEYNIGGKLISSKRYKKIMDNYSGGLVIEHPTKIVPIYTDGSKSTMRYTNLNGKTSWDYSWYETIENCINGKIDTKKMNKILFILKLKNGDNGETVKLIKNYKLEVSKIKKEYNDVIESQLLMVSKLINNTIKPINVIIKSHNGFIVVTYKKSKKSLTKKLNSTVEFYDLKYNKITSKNYYYEYNLTRYHKDKFKEDIVGDEKLAYYNEVVRKTFRNLTYNSRIMAIDYASFNTNIMLKKYNTLFYKRDDTAVITPLTHPIVIFGDRLKRLMYSNSIETYTQKLQEQIRINGFADINEYSKVVRLVSEKLFITNMVHSDDFELEDETGSLSTFNNERYVVQYYTKSKNKVKIKTENYSSFDRHIRFGDMEYLTNHEESVQSDIILPNIKKNVEIMDYDVDYGKKLAYNRKKTKSNITAYNKNKNRIKRQLNNRKDV